MGGGCGGGHGGGCGGGAEEEKRVDVTEEGKQLVRICSSQKKVEWAKTYFCDITMTLKLFELNSIFYSKMGSIA